MVFNGDRDAADWLLVVHPRSSGLFSARRKRGAELIYFMVDALQVQLVTP